MGIGSITSAAQKAATAKAALEALKKRSGKGAERTAKSADVDALGNFNGDVKRATDVDELEVPKRGFEADVIGKDEVKKELTTKQKNAIKRKKQLAAERKKLKELKAAEKGAAEDISNATDDTTEFDDEIAEAIETMKAAFKREAANKK
jgi:hypothetical protein